MACACTPQVEIRAVSERLRGVFTLSDSPAVAKGCCAFSEAPFASSQTLGSRDSVPACAQCLRPLGPLSTHVRAQTSGGLAQPLSSLGELPELPGLASSQCVPCRGGCEARFCCDACCDAALADWHGLLCTGRCAGDAHPLKEFQRHAAANAEIFLLAARALASAVARARREGDTLQAVLAATERLQHYRTPGVWWEVVVFARRAASGASEPGSKEQVASERRLRRTLREQLEESHSLLEAGLRHAHGLGEEYAPLMSLMLYARLAGALQNSVQPITFPSPLTAYCEALLAQPRSMQAAALLLLRPIADAAARRRRTERSDGRGASCARICSALPMPGCAAPSTDARAADAAACLDVSIWGSSAVGFMASTLWGENRCGGAPPATAAQPLAAPATLGPAGIDWDDVPERVVANVAALAPTLFDDVSGIGVSHVTAVLNHSCVPNIQVEADASTGALTAVALRCIAAGEELTVAYVPTHASLHARRASLQAAGHGDFTCACARCFCDADGRRSGELPAAEVHLLAKQAQEEGRYSDAEALLRMLLARPQRPGTLPDGEALHAVGVCLLARGRWLDAHAFWADAARRAPNHPSLNAQAAKDGSYWPAEGAPWQLSMNDHAIPTDDDFSTVPVGAQDFAVVTTTPLLSPEDCTRAVAAAEAAARLRGGWTTARHYDVPTTDIPLHEVPALLAWFNDAMRSSIAPLLVAAYPGDIARPGDIRIHDAFLVRYTAEAQRYLPVHTDESQFSLTIALNSASEYTGGGTFFEESKKVICPDVGHIVAFRGDTRHGGEPITSGTRYIVAVFAFLANTQLGEAEGIVDARRKTDAGAAA